MAVLSLQRIGSYWAFDAAQCRAAGKALAQAYRSADPFPHIAIDDFLDPAVLRQVAASYPVAEGKAFFNRDQERLKYQFRPEESQSDLVRNLLAELNSSAFL